MRGALVSWRLTVACGLRCNVAKVPYPLMVFKEAFSQPAVRTVCLFCSAPLGSGGQCSDPSHYDKSHTGTEAALAPPAPNTTWSTNRVDLLNDPNSNAPPDVKAANRADINDSIETVSAIAARNTQRDRHAEAHALRDRVMADYVPGKRHEPKRLAEAHPDVSLRQIRKWIAQLRKAAAAPPLNTAAPPDWRTVFQGETLRHQNRRAARSSKKPKG